MRHGFKFALFFVLALALIPIGWAQGFTRIALSCTPPAPVGGTSPIAGFNFYRGTTAGGPYVKLNTAPVATCSFSDTTATPGVAYFYTATSVNGFGVESTMKSNEATATLPVTPPNPPTALTAVPE